MSSHIVNANKMVKLQTRSLSSAALSWAVGLAEGKQMIIQPCGGYGTGSRIFVVEGLATIRWRPDQDWSQCGPLIAKHDICFNPINSPPSDVQGFCAYMRGHPLHSAFGENHLLAACRAIAMAAIGFDVSIPAELVPDL